MGSLIVCVSVSHGNTWKVADTIAAVLGATVVEPEQVALDRLGDYDLVGFGSGIYGFAVHPRLTALVGRLVPVAGQKAFVFATYGSPEPRFWSATSAIARRLTAKGFDVVGSFSCRGFDTWLPLRLVGGLNKGHADDRDLARAAAFAERLRDGLRADQASPPQR
jgi:flavodoxin